MAGKKNRFQVEVIEVGIHEGSGFPIHRWVVTDGAKYRAEINECPCGLWVKLGSNNETGETYGYMIANCLCRSDACRDKPVSKSRVCHGWHADRVDKFVAQLGKLTRTHRPEPLKPNRYAPVAIKRVPEWDSEIERVVSENRPAPWGTDGQLILGV